MLAFGSLLGGLVVCERTDATVGVSVQRWAAILRMVAAQTMDANPHLGGDSSNSQR